MTALLQSSHWLPHKSFDDLLALRAGNPDNPLYRKFLYKKSSDFSIDLVSHPRVLPEYPQSVLKKWLGPNAKLVSGHYLQSVMFFDESYFFHLHFPATGSGDRIVFAIVVDTTYDESMHANEIDLEELESLILPLKSEQISTTAGKTQRLYIFNIPRILLYDFVFAIMRMGDLDTHCDVNDLRKMIDDFIAAFPRK